jgi:hypothetical protein
LSLNAAGMAQPAIPMRTLLHAPSFAVNGMRGAAGLIKCRELL